MGHPEDRLETLDPLRAKLGKPVNMDGEEQLEYRWYLNRGQKLVRQEDWLNSAKKSDSLTKCVQQRLAAHPSLKF